MFGLNVCLSVSVLHSVSLFVSLRHQKGQQAKEKVSSVQTVQMGKQERGMMPHNKLLLLFLYSLNINALSL